MKKNIGLVWLSSALMLSLAACTSSQVSDSEGGSEEAPPAVEPVAETDAAPSDVTEAPTAVSNFDNTDSSLDKSAQAPIEPQALAPAGTTESQGMGTYRVQRGDTLMKIAFESYGDLYQWKKVYLDNKSKIADPNNLVVGTVLSVDEGGAPAGVNRGGEKYKIKKGDTLGSISTEVYGTSKKWRKLWENNKQLIRDPNRIFAGFYLYYTLSPDEQNRPATIGGTPSAPEDKKSDARDPAASKSAN